MSERTQRSPRRSGGRGRLACRAARGRTPRGTWPAPSPSPPPSPPAQQPPLIASQQKQQRRIRSKPVPLRARQIKGRIGLDWHERRTHGKSSAASAAEKTPPGDVIAGRRRSRVGIGMGGSIGCGWAEQCEGIGDFGGRKLELVVGEHAAFVRRRPVVFARLRPRRRVPPRIRVASPTTPRCSETTTGLVYSSGNEADFTELRCSPAPLLNNWMFPNSFLKKLISCTTAPHSFHQRLIYYAHTSLI